MAQEKYEMVDHPTHYNNYSVECVDMMVRIFGVRRPRRSGVR